MVQQEAAERLETQLGESHEKVAALEEDIQVPGVGWGGVGVRWAAADQGRGMGSCMAWV